MSKRATAAESDYMGRIARMGCILCDLLGQRQESKTDVHHVRTGFGGAQRAPNWLTVPLCHSGCHMGPLGIHGDQTLLRIAKVTEMELLALTIERIYRRAA